ncbi:Protein of unknown function (DUF1644 [Striga hermonthica]|uniref:Uncharacterized protein n=1 Tax=Striga hermonthica TaxID=68872 RepID=A0A9N7MPZ4_STRHE|nr:Protein of unknown function (DUF1644 [Striga hermonthica]
MPKDKRLNSLSLDRAMASPYSRGSNSADPKIDILDEEKQWDDTLCPICMDHPHNAVLLLCSSRQTGCRAFVCDTSYRHSNCLDQLLRSNGTRPLACPLCRGSVSGWEVVGPARDLMNSKTRSCSLETCEFSGTYADLRKHARADHPSGRPFEASPSRQAGWTELERRLDMEDALAYQSHMDFEEPELWDEWGTDGLFDLPGGISDIEDGLLEEIFGGGLSFSYTSSSYTSFSYTDEEDVDSDSSVSRLDSEENGMSRSRSHREADVRSRSGYHRGSSSSARRESYSRQNET